LCLHAADSRSSSCCFDHLCSCILRVQVTKCSLYHTNSHAPSNTLKSRASMQVLPHIASMVAVRPMLLCMLLTPCCTLHDHNPCRCQGPASGTCVQCWTHCCRHCFLNWRQCLLSSSSTSEGALLLRWHLCQTCQTYCSLPTKAGSCFVTRQPVQQACQYATRRHPCTIASDIFYQGRGAAKFAMQRLHGSIEGAVSMASAVFNSNTTAAASLQSICDALKSGSSVAEAIAQSSSSGNGQAVAEAIAEAAGGGEAACAYACGLCCKIGCRAKHYIVPLLKKQSIAPPAPLPQ
jgi:hypothetical protein